VVATGSSIGDMSLRTVVGPCVYGQVVVHSTGLYNDAVVVQVLENLIVAAPVSVDC
jgi:hypothetical protein